MVQKLVEGTQEEYELVMAIVDENPTIRETVNLASKLLMHALYMINMELVKKDCAALHEYGLLAKIPTQDNFTVQ